MKNIPSGLRIATLGALVFLWISISLVSSENVRPASMSFEQVMTTSKGVFVTKVWIRGDKKRTETTAKTGQQIDIIRGNIYIQILPDLGVARTMSLARGATASPLDNLTSSASAGKHDAGQKPRLRAAGTGTIADLPCEIYEIQMDDGRTARVWISEKVPFPIKWEEMDKKEGTFSYEVRNLKLLANIPDSYFEVPEGYKIIDASMDPMPGEAWSAP